MEARESCKVEKSLICSCGANYKFEFNTDLDISSMSINAQCSKCNSQLILSLDSLLRNKISTGGTSTTLSSSLNFMEQQSTNDTSKEIMDIFKE